MGINKTLLYAKSIDGQLVFDNKKILADFLAKNNGKTFEVSIKRERGMRTMNQNSALHLYFSLLAKALNDAGYSVQMVLKEKVELEWDMEKIKNLLWRPAQEAILGKKSTIELGKVEDIDLVYEHLNRHLSEKFGIYQEFPNDPTN